QFDRSRFLLDRDSYNGWVILSAFTGSFYFSVDLDRRSEWTRRAREGALTLSGECGLGDLVVCPPGAVLTRTITTAPTTFLFAEFGPEPVPRPGKATVRDVPRLQSTYDYIATVCAEPPGRQRQDALAHLVEDLLLLIRVDRTESEQPTDPLMARVAELLTEHAFGDGPSLAALAERMGLSPS